LRAGKALLRSQRTSLPLHEKVRDVLELQRIQTHVTLIFNDELRRLAPKK
jgi:hypothetical protein